MCQGRVRKEMWWAWQQGHDESGKEDLEIERVAALRGADHTTEAACHFISLAKWSQVLHRQLHRVCVCVCVCVNGPGCHGGLDCTGHRLL